MMLLRQGRPVTTVSLGEELELRWTFSSNPSKQKDSKGHNKLGKTVLRRSTQYGFFVENCTAERLDGLAPEPPPLPLVTKGCPDARIREQLMRDPISKTFDGFNTSVKVFRFDGSRRVRIKCSVNICVEQCKPVVCPFGEDVDDTKLSYGRRKRRQTIGELAELVEKYDKVRNEVLRKKVVSGFQQVGARISRKWDTIQQSTITGSYTIMDGAIEPSSNGRPSEGGNDENELLPPASKDRYLASSSTSSTCGEGVNNQALIKSSSICLQRTVFIALLVAVAFLTTVQTFHLLQLFARSVQRKTRGRRERTIVHSTTNDSSLPTLPQLLLIVAIIEPIFTLLIPH
uniref:ZP domain-containing protein n=1 Tax=Ditylenchus dipsaci TaxID=166011 RepID=A0A915DDB8_9BILA